MYVICETFHFKADIHLLFPIMYVYNIYYSFCDAVCLFSDNGGITGAGLVTSEYQRMGMGLSEMWRITECNTKYKYA